MIQCLCKDRDYYGCHASNYSAYLVIEVGLCVVMHDAGRLTDGEQGTVGSRAYRL